MLIALALVLPSGPPHGNGLILLLGFFLLAIGVAVLLLQLVLPKPPEPSDSPPSTHDDPEG